MPWRTGGAPGVARAVDVDVTQPQTTVTVRPGDTLRLHLFEDTVESPLTWTIWMAPGAATPPALTLLDTQRTSAGDHGPAMLRYDVVYSLKVGPAAGLSAPLLFVQDAPALNSDLRLRFPRCCAR
ncbi:hypothetical protein [Deinococcus multiflagellatus]|uniref:Proteinase inhibitor I42 chagasin domain-containing protein n=1 Tax=Deinococcus multiflagellatus TaxID=1656887 RepID=A0ABW1ZLE9_9DEIO